MYVGAQATWELEENAFNWFVRLVASTAADKPNDHLRLVVSTVLDDPILLSQLLVEVHDDATMSLPEVRSQNEMAGLASVMRLFIFNFCDNSARQKAAASVWNVGDVSLPGRSRRSDSHAAAPVL